MCCYFLSVKCLPMATFWSDLIDDYMWSEIWYVKFSAPCILAHRRPFTTQRGRMQMQTHVVILSKTAAAHGFRLDPANPLLSTISKIKPRNEISTTKVHLCRLWRAESKSNICMLVVHGLQFRFEIQIQLKLTKPVCHEVPDPMLHQINSSFPNRYESFLSKYLITFLFSKYYS